MNKTYLTIRVLIVLISVLLAIGVAQSLVMADTFHCVVVSRVGICYWYHGK